MLRKKIVKSIKMLLPTLLMATSCAMHNNNQDILNTVNSASVDDSITIFAAASTKESVNEISSNFQKQNNVKVSTFFGSSADLAKKINNGEKADIFISANQESMNEANKNNRINLLSKTNFLGNSLVLIAQKEIRISTKFQKEFDFSGSFDGKLAIANPDSVPAGIYAKESLSSLGWWSSVQNKLEIGSDVRKTLDLVETGKCEVGIVYSTDAKVSSKVKVLGVFPSKTHSPIVYPFSLTNTNNPKAKDLFNYLQSDKAKNIFVKRGFTILDN